MFIFGKALWLVAQPLSLAFILKLLAVILALRRRFRLALAASLLAILILFVTLFLVRRLEPADPRGAPSAAVPAARGYYVHRRAGWRLRS